MSIPIFDLKSEYQEIRDEINAAIYQVMESGVYIMSHNVFRLEREISEYIGTKYAISVANGTDALLLSLHALGIGPGDEVITSPYTFFATAEAVSRVGAIPVFADINPQTYNIDPNEIQKYITKKTKAIIPVHIFGQPANMNEIMDMASKHGLHVIEDACQAFGSSYKGKKTGSIGNVGCFSFFPTKNLGCCGDGGIVVTNNEDIAKKISLLRTHGGQKKYVHTVLGFNSRLDEIQAAILRVKLRHVDRWNFKRNQIAHTYNKLLDADFFARCKISIPYEDKDCYHTYHLYALSIPERDDLKRYLENSGIAAGVYYPIPLHLQEVYRGLGYKRGDMPNAEKMAEKVLCLPMGTSLSDSSIKYIVQEIKKFYLSRC
jgi:dTDP-4-amino-4,6-dideoxygalactose transaminase